MPCDKHTFERPHYKHAGDTLWFKHNLFHDITIMQVYNENIKKTHRTEAKLSEF